MDQPERVVILVVMEESIFAQMLQHFPHDHYELLMARESAEAIALCETRSPRLAVVPTTLAGGGLADVLAEVRHEDVLLLGVAPSADELERTEAGTLQIFDNVVAPVDGAELADAVRELLKERRKHPRVHLEFPVVLGDDGEGIVREFSATSLRVETDEELRGGSFIRVRIGWGDKPIEFRAIVGRIQRALFFAQHSVVLHVQEKETEAKAYLDKLVRGVVELQHILSGSEEGLGRLRGETAWELTRRAEGTLRDSKGLVIRESGELAIITDLGEERGEDRPDALEARYDLTYAIERWGVGDVIAATHKLLGRQVLLKVLREEYRDDEKARLRIELEARCPVVWSGKNIVDVLDFGSDGQGGLYYAMQALSGETLAKTLNRGQELSPLEVAALGVHLAEALTRLHLRGGGHYDLCPENIYLHRPGGTAVRPVLINVAGPEIWGPPDKTFAIGAFYRPPEAVEGGPDITYDVFALAVVLKEALPAWAQVEGAKRSIGTRHLAGVLGRASSPVLTERFRDIETFRNALEESHTVLEAEAPSGLARFVEPPGRSGRSSAMPTPVPRRIRDTGERAAAVTQDPEDDLPVLVTRLTPPPPVRLTPIPMAPLRLTPIPPPRPTPPPPRRYRPAPETVTPRLDLSASSLPVSKTPLPERTTEPPSPEASPGPPPIPPEPPPIPLSAKAPHPSSMVGVTEDLSLAALEELPSEELVDEPGLPRRSPLGLVLGFVALVAVLLGLLWLVIVAQPWQTSGVAASRAVGGGRDHAGAEGGGLAALQIDIGDAQSSPTEPEASAGADAGAAPEASPASADTGVGPEAATSLDAGPADAAQVEPADAAQVDAAGAQVDAAGAQVDAAGAEPGPGEADGALEGLSPMERRTELLGKARRRIRRGLHGEAMDYIDEARHIREGADIHYLLSMSYEKRGRYQPAIDSLRKAVTIAPSSSRYQGQLGRLYLKIGQRSKACDFLRKALELNPNSRSTKQRYESTCSRPRSR